LSTDNEYTLDNATKLLDKARVTLESYSSIINAHTTGKRLFRPVDKRLYLAVCEELLINIGPYIEDTLTPPLTPTQHSVFMRVYSDLRALRRGLSVRSTMSREALLDKLEYDRDLQSASYAVLLSILQDQEEESNRASYPEDLNV